MAEEEEDAGDVRFHANGDGGGGGSSLDCGSATPTHSGEVGLGRPRRIVGSASVGVWDSIYNTSSARRALLSLADFAREFLSFTRACRLALSRMPLFSSFSLLSPFLGSLAKVSGDSSGSATIQRCAAHARAGRLPRSAVGITDEPLSLSPSLTVPTFLLVACKKRKYQ